MEIFNINNYCKKLLFPLKKQNFTKINNFSKNIYDYYNSNYDNFLSFDNKIIKYCSFIDKGRINKTAVIYVHSYNSNMQEGEVLLDYCINNSYNLFLYDSRGNGASSDSPISFGYYEKHDLLYFIIEIVTKSAINCEFILWGRSMGANTIILLLSELINNIKIGENNIYDIIEKGNKQYNMSPNNNIKNTYLHESILNYYTNNNIKSATNNIKFSIIQIVLDSPYSSFKCLIKDQLNRITSLLNLIKKPIINKIYEALYQYLKFDPRNLNNIKYKLAHIVLPIYLIYSKSDYLIPEKRFKSLISSNNNIIPVLITEEHNKKRSNNIYKYIFKLLKNNKDNNNNYIFSELIKINNTNHCRYNSSESVINIYNLSTKENHNINIFGISKKRKEVKYNDYFTINKQANSKSIFK